MYLFFVLSGASLAYIYSDQLASRVTTRKFSFSRFLWVRYLRLAPLYLALMAVVLPWKLLKEGLSSGLALAPLSICGRLPPPTSYSIALLGPMSL